MKAVEILGMEQARSWKVATLNELREFFQLKPHETWIEINSDPDVAATLEKLYDKVELVELYPGIVAEQATLPDTIGQGLCPGSTVSKAILLNTVALIRGDRYYTMDYTPGSLTHWGYKQASADPQVAGGGVIYKLLMRAYPGFYVDNSVYAMFPFTIPSETRKILQTLGKDDDYDFSPPSSVDPPIPIASWTGVTSVLDDQAKFKVPWGPRIRCLTGHDYMLSDDSGASARQKWFVHNAFYKPPDGLEEIRQFYETLTMQLVRQNSAKLGKIYQLDAVRLVGNASHANFIAYMFKIPMLDSSYGKGTYIDQDFYKHLAFVFAYIFVDLDPPSSFTLKVAAVDAAKELGRVVRSVCEKALPRKVSLDETVEGLDSLEYNIGKGPAASFLIHYGVRLLDRLEAGGKSVDEVTWTIIPTAAAAVATQAQGFAQMLDLYLSDPYKSHWPAIQKLAASDSSEAFQQLKRYALEGYRLNTPAFGLTRIADVDTTIEDGNRSVRVKKGDRIFVNLATASLDPTVFPNPQVIDLTRPLDKYIHHGWGPHGCIGRPIVETAMAAQLRVFAQLKNLRRAPGGELKSKTVNGPFKVFMTKDWSDWWPFPTSKFSFRKVKTGMLTLTAAMDVQWDGFESWSPLAEGSVLLTKYPCRGDEME
ncbi:hypothetical protein HO133_001452 [Letharia lupina]|uniref:Uncharacterized protein n=1 Tax=Letharia lupina TaxID=560253 RepID=A0A8H6FBT4_9LECA|nr:uncharacterized protein HO133_001452 [Letharia lupina]KAF6222366.1 hypothetical protein HO133_001452 [Letharia lupina]